MTDETVKEGNNQALMLASVKTDAIGRFHPTNLAEAIEVSKLIAHSGMVPKDYVGKTGAVLVAMQMGFELGLSPMSAIQNIAVINGRPSIWGDAMLALVVSHRDCEDVVETFDDKTMTASCMVKRRGRSPIERTFSMADAKTAGLAGKQGPWSQYPKRMLQQRARGFALRDAFPDALRGIVSCEEARDTVIDVTPSVTESLPTPGRSSFKDKPVIEETPHDAETGEVIEEEQPPEPTQEAVSEALQNVLAGIECAQEWSELNRMAGAVNKLGAGDKDIAKAAFMRRKEEIESVREPGGEG